MADEIPSNSRTTSKPVALQQGPRIIAGIVGGLALTAGSMAVFFRDVEAGPALLIAVGALFLLISLAGVLPTRLKYGDREAEFIEAATEYVAETISKAPPEDKAAEIQRATELASTAPELAAEALSRVALRDAAADLVRGVAASIPSAQVRDLASGYSGRQLLLLQGQGGGTVLIELTPSGFSNPVPSLGADLDPTWAVLFVRLEDRPYINLDLYNRPVAVFLYRPDSAFKRDSLLRILEDLLEESRALVQARRED